MGFSIRPGVFPTMITPYTTDNRIDFNAVEELVEYYVRTGCVGIFALCHSSEIQFLTLAEKREFLRCVTQSAAGRLQVVASGNTSSEFEAQLEELTAAAEEGADAVVLVTNRMARQEESEDVFIRHTERILDALPKLTFGIYECPFPYKRIVPPETMNWCAQTGRIVFIKDTCCDAELLKQKQQAVQGTPLKIYNANTATLLQSLDMGIEGYSGIMANFHADLYVELFKLHKAGDPLAAELHHFLTLAALIEYQLYPINARYRRQLSGMNITLHTRMRDISLWNATFATEVKALYQMEQQWRRRFGLPLDESKDK